MAHTARFGFPVLTAWRRKSRRGVRLRSARKELFSFNCRTIRFPILGSFAFVVIVVGVVVEVHSLRDCADCWPWIFRIVFFCQVSALLLQEEIARRRQWNEVKGSLQNRWSWIVYLAIFFSFVSRYLLQSACFCGTLGLKTTESATSVDDCRAAQFLEMWFLGKKRRGISLL